MVMKMKNIVDIMIQMAKPPKYTSFVYLDKSPKAIDHITDKMIKFTGGKNKKRF